MTRRALSDDNIKYADVTAHFERHPQVREIKRKNATVKVYGPHGTVMYHDHPGQTVPGGTLRSIRRMAVLAGLFIICLVVAATLVLPLGA